MKKRTTKLINIFAIACIILLISFFLPVVLSNKMALAEENLEYTITFDSMGGSAEQSITVFNGTAVGTLPLPVKLNFTFVEWNTSADGKGQTYTELTVFSANQNITLYALWQTDVALLNYAYVEESGEIIGVEITALDVALSGELILPDYIDGYPVISIANDAFFETDIVKLVLNSNLQSIGENAFDSCLNLSEIVMNESLETIQSQAFFFCENLQSVILPDSLVSIGDAAFRNCVALKEVFFGNGIINIETRAFYSCISLEKVVVKSTTPPILGRAVFGGQSSLQKIYVPAALIDTYKAASGWLEVSDYITAVLITFETNGAEPIAPLFIDYGSQLVLPADPIKEFFIFNGWFFDTSFENEFDSSVEITEDLTLYANWTHLFKYQIVENEAIILGANIEISGALSFPETIDGYLVTEIADDAFAVANITSVTLPNSMKKIGDYAFIDCVSITAVSIPEGVEYIGQEAFFGCASLEEVTLPGTLSYLEDSAFRNCTSLLKVVFNNGETSLTVGNSAFRDCATLKEVTLSANTISVGKRAFYNCTALNLVKIRNNSTVIDLGTSAFDLTSSTLQIKVPQEVYDLYITETAWSRYRNNIEKININTFPFHINSNDFELINHNGNDFWVYELNAAFDISPSDWFLITGTIDGVEYEKSSFAEMGSDPEGAVFIRISECDYLFLWNYVDLDNVCYDETKACFTAVPVPIDFDLTITKIEPELAQLPLRVTTEDFDHITFKYGAAEPNGWMCALDGVLDVSENDLLLITGTIMGQDYVIYSNNFINNTTTFDGIDITMITLIEAFDPFIILNNCRYMLYNEGYSMICYLSGILPTDTDFTISKFSKDSSLFVPQNLNVLQSEGNTTLTWTDENEVANIKEYRITLNDSVEIIVPAGVKNLDLTGYVSVGQSYEIKVLAVGNTNNYSNFGYIEYTVQ